MPAPAPTHVIPLRLVQPARLDPARAAAVFTDDAAWLGTPIPGPRADGRRYLTDLSLPVRERAPLMTFRKAAFVDLGAVRPRGDGFEVEISWRSSSLAPLFPVFAGHLTVTAREIRLEGYYAPPGGEVGVILDRAFLNIAARGTARWFLEQVTGALTAVGGVVIGPLREPAEPPLTVLEGAGRAEEPEPAEDAASA